MNDDFKIIIHKSPTADSRTCDVTKVTREQLLESSYQHIDDVQKGLNFFIELMKVQSELHDETKISNIDDFYRNFKSNFEEKDWYEMHQDKERHHLKEEKYIQEDIDLIDVLEQITDCVMAGMARSGEFRQEPISPELLLKAYNNTVKLLLSKVEVKE